MHRPLPPAGSHATGRPAWACAGGGQLEFVVAVAIVGVLLAVFLNRVSEVQVLADDAQAVSLSSHERAVNALIEARSPLPGHAVASAAPASASAQARLVRAVP